MIVEDDLDIDPVDIDYLAHVAYKEAYVNRVEIIDASPAGQMRGRLGRDINNPRNTFIV